MAFDTRAQTGRGQLTWTLRLSVERIKFSLRSSQSQRLRKTKDVERDGPALVGSESGKAAWIIHLSQLSALSCGGAGMLSMLGNSK
jgi:hypothetical protein